MHLNKLVYFAHGWMLGLYSEPLIHEKVETWKYGPVIKSVYEEYQGFGREPVTDTTLPKEDLFRQEVSTLIRQVNEVYGHMDAFALSGVTHEYGSPWFIASLQFDSTIDNKLIEGYFKELSRAR